MGQLYLASVGVLEDLEVGTGSGCDLNASQSYLKLTKNKFKNSKIYVERTFWRMTLEILFKKSNITDAHMYS